MKDLKKDNITPNNAEQDVAKESSEKELEKGKIVLNENGELVGDLGWDDSEFDYQESDENASATQPQEDVEEEVVEAEKEEKSEETEEDEEVKEEDSQEEIKYYTPEEIMDTTLDKIDPKRLPPILQKIYKNMQADYTRKTQEAAKIRKAAERLVNEVMSKPLTELPKDVIDNITKQADLIVRQQLGSDVDEFDSNYVALKATVVQELANQYKKQVQTTEILQRTEQMLRASEPNYQAIEQIALQLIPTLPYERVLEIEQAKNTGNVKPLIELFEEARKIFYSNNFANQAQEQLANQNTMPPQPQQQPKAQRPKPNPPAVESGGQLNLEDTNPKPKVRPQDLAGKSVDQQAELLLKLGLIE